jgi:hypothetical protein
MAGGGDPPANEVQEFVKLMLETQADFDIAPEARAPVPRDWAMQIGRLLTEIPESGKGALMDAHKAAVVERYSYLQTFFGDYTDEVLSYAISEYKGMSKPMADLLAGYVIQLRNGSGLFRPKAVDSMLDQEQVDSFGFGGLSGAPLIGPFVGVLNGLGGAGTEEGLSPEEQLRAREAEEQ